MHPGGRGICGAPPISVKMLSSVPLVFSEDCVSGPTFIVY